MESQFTATGLVLNERADKALLIFHKKLQLWLPAGGHVEMNELPHEAAVREVFEETGITATILDPSPDLALTSKRESQIPAPRWILHELIPAYQDKPTHLHYDFIYQMQAACEMCVHAEREVESAKWFTRQELQEIETSDATRKMYLLILR